MPDRWNQAGRKEDIHEIIKLYLSYLLPKIVIPLGQPNDGVDIGEHRPDSQQDAGILEQHRQGYVH